MGKVRIVKQNQRGRTAWRGRMRAREREVKGREGQEVVESALHERWKDEMDEGVL